MKKHLSIILFLSLILIFSSCGNKESTGNNENSDSSTTKTSETETSQVSQDSVEPDSIITSCFYSYTTTFEGTDYDCMFFLVPPTKEASLADEPNYRYKTAKYEENNTHLIITCEDGIWNFKKENDALVYIAEGSSPLCAETSRFGNSDAQTITLENGTIIPLAETSVLKTGVYTCEGATLTIDVVTMSFKLDLNDGTSLDSTFMLLNDGSCADEKNNNSQFYVSAPDTISFYFPEFEGDFTFTK